MSRLTDYLKKKKDARERRTKRRLRSRSNFQQHDDLADDMIMTGLVMSMTDDSHTQTSETDVSTDTTSDSVSDSGSSFDSGSGFSDFGGID